MKEEDFLHEEAFRDRVSTVTDTGKRNWVFALKPSGKWYNYRKILAYFYLAIFFILPFIKVNGLPFMLINITEGKFILFSKIFWPQDFFIFAIAMITFIIFIVLFTVVFGRLFCGWVCPQTVFMEFVFRPIEWLIEGSPNQQRKLNESTWNKEKMFKKGLKHFIFFMISFVISHTFLCYILGVDEVYKIIREPFSEHLGLLTGLIFFTYLFYAVFAFVRDLVCTTVCPYGRLQGVMFDKDTIQIAYDYKRGEPRGKFKKGVDRVEGDCINCLKCIHVCPTGIDIRNGLQMECVGCTACIDACNEVMDTVHMERGLIRYASENEISKGEKFHFNSRMKAYTVLLTIMIIVMGVLIGTRKTVDTYISRVKGQLYQEVPGDKISNLFDAKIINKTRSEFPITLRLENGEGTIRLVGSNVFTLKKESINEFTFFLDLPKSALTERSNDIKIGVYNGEERIQTVSTKFLGPFK
ncbi:MAG: cytochrome c oxidase accessory protein CcoG [Saprospiraceae bacterium]|nr:cytochrome c oxidase accessory protein CcoG [Saprospiraceae bacterium]